MYTAAEAARTITANGRQRLVALNFSAPGARFLVSGPTDSFLCTGRVFYGKESKNLSRNLERPSEDLKLPCTRRAPCASGCGCLNLAVEVPRLPFDYAEGQF